MFAAVPDRGCWAAVPVGGVVRAPESVEIEPEPGNRYQESESTSGGWRTVGGVSCRFDATD